MTTVTDHGLVCLDDNDYSAIALAMQADAYATEAAIGSVNTSLTTALTRPYVNAVTTVGQGPLSSGGEILENQGVWAIASTNIPVVTTAAVSGIRITIPRAGVYRYGTYCNLVAAGAVTAVSRRTIVGRATRRVLGIGNTLSLITWRTWDTNTGGEHLIASGGTFLALAGQTVDVDSFWSHANLASNVSSTAGARIWCIYMGSGVEIGSV